MPASENREVCYRCRKARVMCYCDSLAPFESDPEFVILIHPKETRKAINTGRMAFLNITNSRLIVGNDFSEDEALNSLLSDTRRRCHLLFPGPDAIDIADLPKVDSEAETKDVFIILDATWSMAKKMFRLSSNLQSLPQVAFRPPSPSGFLIRQQPNVSCYSTIETIHHIIETRGTRLAEQRHHHLIRLFKEMVQKQIEYEKA